MVIRFADVFITGNQQSFYTTWHTAAHNRDLCKQINLLSICFPSIADIKYRPIQARF